MRVLLTLLFVLVSGLGGCLAQALPPESPPPAAGAPPPAQPPPHPAPVPEGDVVSVEAPSSNGHGRAEVGRPFADFVGPLVGGGVLKLSDVAGPKVVLLQFWGVRCSPCLAEMALLSDLHKRYEGRGLLVIGVNTDSAEEPRLRSTMQAKGIAPSYPVVCDTDFSISKRYTQWLIPVAVLIDRKGVVRAIHTGYNPKVGANLEAEVARLLDEVR